MSAAFSTVYEIYQAQPVLWQRLIVFVAILVGLFACVTFVRLIGDVVDQTLGPRDLPPSWSLRNVEPVDPERERQVLDALASISTQPPRCLPHERTIRVEVR